MASVKINNKTYQVPELNFQHSLIMEQMGLPLDGMIGTSRIFTAVQAFTVIVAECSPEKAAYLVEQHILGGGDIESIYKAYVAAITESAFFRKLLHLDEQETAKSRNHLRRRNRSRHRAKNNLFQPYQRCMAASSNPNGYPSGCILAAQSKVHVYVSGQLHQRKTGTAENVGRCGILSGTICAAGDCFML